MNYDFKKHISSKIFKVIAYASAELGYKSYVIGGYVRDILLRRPSNDIDVVTVGSGITLAKKVASLLPGHKEAKYYGAFGTAMIRFDGMEVEFVGARKESYDRNSRKPVVENGTLEDDISRRDFTINAMALSLNPEDFGDLIDLYGGMEDMEELLLRTPLDPDITYSDDPLRMMRAIRFASQLRFYIEPESFDAIKRNANRIKIVSMERVTEELNNQDHDYGHGKYETVATLFIGLALAAAAIGIVVSATTKLAGWLQGEELPAPGALALWAALISIVAKELLYQYTARQGRKLNSQVMIANAWHHRSDALSSVGAAIGIGLAIWLGQRWAVCDPLASIVVGLILVKVAYELLKTSINELTESSLPAETEQEIEQIIQSFDDVQQPHNLRTRRIGNRIAIEVHVRMDGQLPLDVVHERATTIERKLKDRFGADTHVALHMEPVK